MEKKYISIDQLWKCETCFYMGSNGNCRSDCDAVESYRPSYSKFEFADVAPVVHGRWVKSTEREYDYVCSVCGEYACEDRYYNKALLTDFCPHCGAKMDEEEKHG